MLYNKLRKDPFYFFRCVVTKTIVLSLVYMMVLFSIGYQENLVFFAIFSFFLVSPNPKVQLLTASICLIGAYYFHQTNPLIVFLLVLFGTYWGGMMVILMHNTGHEIIKNKILNRILGEISSVFNTVGFINFVYIHFEHHVHSDQEEDPHHNMSGLNFLDYMASMGRNIGKKFQVYLPEKVCRTKNQYRVLVLCVLLNKLLLLHLMILLLGEQGFSYFSVPCILGSQFLFAYINYYTHPNDVHGRATIIDLDRTWLDKGINRLFYGVLYHKTHHRHPKIANPMKYACQKDSISLETTVFE